MKSSGQAFLILMKELSSREVERLVQTQSKLVRESSRTLVHDFKLSMDFPAFG